MIMFLAGNWSYEDFSEMYNNFTSFFNSSVTGTGRSAVHIIHLSAEKLQSDIQLQAHVGIQVGTTLLSFRAQRVGRGAYSGQLVWPGRRGGRYNCP